MTSVQMSKYADALKANVFGVYTMLSNDGEVK